MAPLPSSDAERCYLAALRILGYRFNSETELRRKLQRKNFERATVDAAVARLREEKWLDDERFAGAFARTRARRRIGAKRIVLELRAAGVDDETASRAVRENVNPEEEREQLRAVIARRAKLLATPEGRRKLIGYLMKQGYDSALIHQELADSRSQS
jgi:regulatory protein